MKKQDAYKSFVYHGERIYSPTGRKSEHHENMRRAWAWAYDSGYYKKLPSDVIKADKILHDLFNKGNPIHPMAIEARKRYIEDSKSGHKAATEYWRGQAGAYFTGNPTRLAIRKITYRSKPGYLVYGSYDGYTGQKIFFKEESQAREFVRRVKAGEKSTDILEDIWKNPLLEGLITGLGFGTGIVMAGAATKKLLNQKNPISKREVCVREAIKVLGQSKNYDPTGVRRDACIIRDIERHCGLNWRAKTHRQIIQKVLNETKQVKTGHIIEFGPYSKVPAVHYIFKNPLTPKGNPATKTPKTRLKEGVKMIDPISDGITEKVRERAWKKGCVI